MTTKINKKVMATRNKANQVEKPKMKSIPMPKKAATEVARQSQALDTYIQGIVVGMDITGPWVLDMRNKCILVPDSKKE